MQEAGWERRDETEGLFLAKSFPPCRLIIQEQSVCMCLAVPAWMRWRMIIDGCNGPSHNDDWKNTCIVV